jgi:hypothetical protein
MVDAYNSMLLKKEVISGTDAAPTPAANAVLTRNLTVKPLATDQLPRNQRRPTSVRKSVTSWSWQDPVPLALRLPGWSIWKCAEWKRR